MKNIFLLTIITLFVFGCSGSKDLKTESPKKSSQLMLCQTKVANLTADNELLNTKIADLEMSNKDINAKLKACDDEISELSSIYNSYNSKIKKMKRELEAAFPNNLKDANFAIVEEDGRLIIRLPNRILYSSGSAEFNAEALMVIQKLATIIKDNEGLYLMVEGHTDDIPVRKGSKYEDNWDLSLARSVKIVRQLVTYGVHSYRITAAGRANYAPLDRTVSEEARAKNRRTEIIIRPKISEVLKAMSELD